MLSWKSLLLLLVCFSSSSLSCLNLIDGWIPLSVEERATSKQAKIVLIGYINRTFKSERYSQNANGPDAKQYTAEVIVLDVLKDTIDHVKAQRALNVSNFGRRQDCYSDVRNNRVYILFVTFAKNQLWAVYDDIYGAAEEYSRDLEVRLQRVLGITDWSTWSACSAKCGAGRQFRERRCVSCGNWSEIQTRTCNLFACSLVYQQLSNRSILISDRSYGGFSINVNDTILRSQPQLTNFSVMLMLTADNLTSIPGVHLFTIEDGKNRPKLAVVLRYGQLHVWSANRNQPRNSGKQLDDRLPLPLALFDNRTHALTISIVNNELFLEVDALYSIRQQLASPLALKLPQKNLVRWSLNIGQLAFESPLLTSANTVVGNANARNRKRLADAGGQPRTLAQISNVIITTAVTNISAYVSVPQSTQSAQRVLPAAIRNGNQAVRRTSPLSKNPRLTTTAPLNGFNWLQAEQKPLRRLTQLTTERPRVTQQRTLQSDIFVVVEDSWCSQGVSGAQSLRRTEATKASPACMNGGTCIIVDRLSYFQLMCLCPPGYYGLYCHLQINDAQNVNVTSRSNV